MSRIEGLNALTNMESKKPATKVPKRVIHFSDGIVPEYSTEEEDTTDAAKSEKTEHLDPASLNWKDWLRFKSIQWGSTTLSVCDSLGDSLSSFFGITTPKYQFEIDHYNMMKKLENEISDTELGMITKSEPKSKNLSS